MSDELKKIKEKITQNKDFLRNTYGLKNLGVFGSFARNEDTFLSDIDILFEIDEKQNLVSLFELSDIKEYLESVLGKTVDIVDKNHIKPFLREKILNEVVMI